MNREVIVQMWCTMAGYREENDVRDTPRMGRGHFNALARALAETRPTDSPSRLSQWRYDVRAIAEVCYDASNFTPNGNRAFDQDRFLKACGLDPNTEQRGRHTHGTGLVHNHNGQWWTLEHEHAEVSA
jgi:hypothetical protein